MHIEPLESRRLLTGGLTADGSPATVATVTGTTTPTACPVGTNDTFVAYVKSNVLKAVILDPDGNTLVPEFTVSAGGQFASNFGLIAAATDANGNAVIVYPVGTSNTTLFIARVNAAGTIVNAPAPITATNIHDQRNPTLAIGPNNQVAVVYVNGSSIGTRIGVGVFARAFDASDAPLFTETQISDTSAAPGGELITHPAVAYNPAASNYLAAWDIQELNANLSNLREAIEDRSFTPAGTLGIDPEIESTATDTLSAPIPLYDATAGQMTLNYSRNGFDANFAFEGSTAKSAVVDADGTPTATRTLLSSDATNEFILIGAFFQASLVTYLFNNGVFNGSGLTSSGIRALTATIDAHPLADNTAVFPTGQNYDPIVAPSSSNHFVAISGVYTPGTNTTVVKRYPLVYAMPSVPLPDVRMTITNSFRPANGGQPPAIILSASLTDTSPQDAIIHVVTLAQGPTDAFDAIDTNITIPAGQLTADKVITVHALNPRMPSNGGDVVVQYNTLSGVNPASGTVTGGIINGILGTGFAFPLKPLVLNDADGTLVKVSTTDGKVSVIQNKDGTFSFKVEKTNAKTKITIATTTSTNPKLVAADAQTLGDGRFEIKDFTSTSPIGTLAAPIMDLSGNLKIPGISSLTLGNAGHTLSLGTLNNATLKFAHLTAASLTSTGSIKSLAVTDWTGGSLTAGTIGTFTCAGDLDANLTLTSLTSLSVLGALGGTSATDVRTLRATKSLGSITAASLRNASLLAGLKSTAHTLPTKRSSFSNATSSITSITLKGTSPTFANTIIAAPLIGTLKLAGLLSTNPIPFGIIAERITAYSRLPKSVKNTFSPKLIDAADQYAVRTI